MKALILFGSRMDDGEALLTRNILLRAKMVVHSFSFFDKKVITSTGLECYTDYLFSEIVSKDYDILIIPGGPYVNDYHNEYPETVKEIKSFIDYFYKNNKHVALICAAPRFLSDTFAIKNNTYTCFGDTYKLINGGIYKKAPVVTSNHLITGLSGGVVYDFALEIVNVCLGPQAKETILKQYCL